MNGLATLLAVLGIIFGFAALVRASRFEASGRDPKMDAIIVIQSILSMVFGVSAFLLA